ncbi:hypothetical protein [Arthrobacter sp. SO5]|uniref:hypothetical protein n=1 Tax=Arthrobacter sp. SO5 TaxID=1897055 RepID=UPI001E4619E5|nr:hypothetical protein [Arthrobacter sp. SO5]
MKVFGERTRAAVSVLAAGTLMAALAACTPAAPGPAPSGSSSTAAAVPSSASASSSPSATASASPSAEPGTSATVGALVPGFPQTLLPVMPGARVVSSSFDKTTVPATVALVGSIPGPAAAVLAYYTAALEAQGFKAVPGETVGTVPSKDFLRGDNETVNISVMETSGVSTFTIGANVAAESVK